MKTLTFLLFQRSLSFYTMVVLLRVWMQWARCDFYNPFSQFVVKATQPIVGPLRRIIPAMGPIDSASLLVAFILCVIKAIDAVYGDHLPADHLDLRSAYSAENHQLVDLLGTAIDGDHELGQPGP